MTENVNKLKSVMSKKHLLLLVIAPGCLLSPKPKWISEPYRDYPQDRYIVGVGTGKTIAQADDSARREILKQITFQIRSRYEQIERIEIRGNATRTEEKALERIESLAEGKVEEVRIIRRYEDKKEGMWYSLAVFDRLEYSKKMKRKLVEKELEIAEELKNIEQDISEGKVLETVLKLKEVSRRYAQLEQDIALLHAISGSTSSSFQETIRKKMEDLTGIIDITPENEKILLPEPITRVSLSVRVTTKNGKPVKNIPLIARFHCPIFCSENPQTTDKDGTAIFEATVLVGRSAKVEIFSGIPEIPLSTVARILTDRTARFKVTSASESVRDFLSSCLSAHNIELSSTPDITIHATPRARIENVSKDFKGNPFYVVVFSIEVTAKRNHETITRTIRQAKGGDRTPQKALDQAYRSTLSSMCGDLKPLPPDEHIYRLIKDIPR